MKSAARAVRAHDAVTPLTAGPPALSTDSIAMYDGSRGKCMFSLSEGARQELLLQCQSKDLLGAQLDDGATSVAVLNVLSSVCVHESPTLLGDQRIVERILWNILSGLCGMAVTIDLVEEAVGDAVDDVRRYHDEILKRGRDYRVNRLPGRSIAPPTSAAPQDAVPHPLSSHISEAVQTLQILQSQQQQRRRRENAMLSDSDIVTVSTRMSTDAATPLGQQRKFVRPAMNAAPVRLTARVLRSQRTAVEEDAALRVDLHDDGAAYGVGDSDVESYGSSMTMSDVNINEFLSTRRQPGDDLRIDLEDPEV